MDMGTEDLKLLGFHLVERDPASRTSNVDIISGDGRNKVASA